MDATKELDVKKEEMVSTDTTTERTRDRRVFIPRTDIYETDEDIILIADMPGVGKECVDITLEKNVLTIKGTVEEETTDKYAPSFVEYETGDYERSFNISTYIDRDAIEATMKNGVLRVRLPKAGPAKTQKISVKAD
jgi:HSP20 family molecular chaperone IbpA